MTTGIYKISNCKTKEFYIGQSINIEKRFSQHLTLLLKNKHPNRHIQSSFNKYGREFFEFSIYLICDEGELTSKEQESVDKLNPSYNIRKECVTSNKGMIVSDETKEKLSISHIGHTQNRGRKHSEKSRKNMSIAHLNHRQTEESKKKISNTLKGIARPIEVKRKISETKQRKRLEFLHGY